MSANLSKISAQQFADERIAPEYRQTLKTVSEACTANGWADVDHPICCGKPVEITTFIGSPYFAKCKICRKFIADVTGPSFGNSWVQTVSDEKVDMDTEALWIAGIGPES